MKLVICDDNIDYLIKLEFVAEEVFLEIGEEVDIMTFTSYAQMKEYILSGGDKADFVMLDIEMPEISGLELGEIISEKNVGIKIIYVTSHEEYSLKAYDTFPYSYLIKPITKEKLKEVFLRAINEAVQKTKHQLLIKSEQQSIILDIDEILYLEKEQNYIRIVMKNREFKTYSTIKEMEEKLKAYKEIIKCHQSYLVNLNHIWQWCGDEFIMENGARIPISRRYKRVSENEFKKHFEAMI